MSLDTQRWSAPVAIAHRGSRLLWPENTLTAFQGSYDMGLRHFETDLQLTADKVLVCFHDPTVDRTTSGEGAVSSFTLEQLQSLDAGHRHAERGDYPFREKGMQVPTLEELLTTFPDVSVILDMKSDAIAGPLADIVHRLGVGHRLIVGSFSDERLDEFRTLTGGTVPTSTGPVASRMWVLASRMGRGAGGPAQALQVPTHLRGIRVVDEKLVSAAHNAGLQVHVWTVNEIDEMTRLLDIGVDGLISDRPNLLKQVLLDRGEWSGG
ncbi:MAG: glycerophosphodiester phosphodiesterase [Acidimicrobiia bacterium]